jgi:hypothetical protein
VNYIQGNKKRCMGPLHQGEYVPLKYFWHFKKGPRKGKPFARCRACLNYQRFGDTLHGMVPYAKVKFIFDELTNRLGKAETVRRLEVSPNFFYRRKIDNYKYIRIQTVARAMVVLKECRENDVRRHRRSIQHGATARGREERVIEGLGRTEDFYNPHSDIFNEYSRNYARRKRNRTALKLTERD